MIASSNLFSLTQAVAPIGNDTKKQISTIAQLQEKNNKPLKAVSLDQKNENKTKKTKRKRINRPS